MLDNIVLPPAGHYIVAVSGGVDSMALLHFLAGMRQAQGWKLRVAHYEHGIRSDSQLDQQLVRDAAQTYGLPFHTTNGNLGAVSEATARQARYAFLNALLDEYGADAVMTAHHWDDRQETSLYNLSRGAGRVGAAGVRSQGRVLRPLLGVRKAELVHYAREQEIPWREDSTNLDTTNPRNFLRHKLLPLARAVMPGFDQQLHEQLNALGVLNERIARSLEPLIAVSDHLVSIKRSDSDMMSEALLGDLILVMARTLDQGVEVNQLTLLKAAALARRGQAGSEASISGRLMLRVRHNELEVYAADTVRQSLVAQELLPNGSVRYGNHQLSYGPMHIEAGDHYHVAAGDLKVRTMRPGDRIAPIGLNGTKKLQDLFVDAKIDRSDRPTWPVVTRISDDQVVWVPRLAVSRHFLVSSMDAQAYCLIHEVVTA